MRRVIESDVCIIGSGISAAMVAARLAESTSSTIVVVEAGDESDRPAERSALRRRYLDYGETPWRSDHLDGFEVSGIQSRSMQVGGLAMTRVGVSAHRAPHIVVGHRLHHLIGGLGRCPGERVEQGVASGPAVLAQPVREAAGLALG